MKGLILLIIAILLTIIGFFPLLIMQSLARKRDEVRDDYHYNIAIHFDYLWGSLIFGRMTNAKTVSALVVKHDIKWAIHSIDWVFLKAFEENDHCFTAFMNEFAMKGE